jgi:methionyl aminopeptidase
VITIKSKPEFEIMRRAGRLVAETLDKLQAAVKPGVSTADLDKIAYDHITKNGGTPSFKGYHGFPASICTSVNDEVVHGIPSKRRVLEEGDIISIDCGAIIGGWHGDAALTVPVGRTTSEMDRLLEVTEQSLHEGIEQVLPGKRLGDVSAAIQRYAEKNGYSVVREYVGHGIGRQMHEEPQVPNWGTPGRGVLLKQGMALALEPMVNAGAPDVRVLKDNWTVVTQDGKWSAHFEHTVALTENGPEILTKL